MKLFFRFIFLISIITILTSCSHKNSNQQMQLNSHDSSIITVQAKLFPNINSIPGVVITSNKADLAAKVGGWIKHIYVVAGQHVNKDMLLLEMDNSENKATVAQANSEYIAATTNYQQAQRDLNRYHVLLLEKAVAPKEFEEIQNRYNIARANLSSTEIALNTANSNLSYTEIRAPFDGTVSEKNVNEGDFVSAGSSLLQLIGGNAQVQCEVSDEIYSKLKIGENTTIIIDGSRWQAQLIEKVSAADPVTHTHQIKFSLPDNATVSSGSYANVNLVMNNYWAIAVPNSAIVTRAGLEGVFSIDTQNIAHFQLVRIGQSNNGYTEILAGISAGNRILNQPGPDIGNGTDIKPGFIS